MESELYTSCQADVVAFIKDKGLTIPSLVKKEGLPFYVYPLSNENGKMNYPIGKRGRVYANVRFLTDNSYEYRCPFMTKKDGEERINTVWVKVSDPSNIPEWKGGRTRRRLKKRRATRRAKKRTRRSKS